MIPSEEYSEEEMKPGPLFSSDSRSQFEKDRYEYVHGSGIDYTDSRWYERLGESINDNPHLKYIPYGTIVKGGFGLGFAKEHTRNARPSTKGKHQAGQKRKKEDYGGERGDNNRRPPRQKPNGWKGSWPPKN